MNDQNEDKGWPKGTRIISILNYNTTARVFYYIYLWGVNDGDPDIGVPRTIFLTKTFASWIG